MARPTHIVGIGGSAGALNAYKALIEACPRNPGMAFVIISHMHPTASSALAQILSRSTTMEVTVASSAMLIQENRIYVIPPGVDLLVENYALRLVSPRGGRGTQVDVFLTSLAEALGPRAVGVILSGYGSDGTEGCKQIKTRGGTTFAQDMSAEVDSMPLSAQAAGNIDFVLPPGKIPEELQRMAKNFPPQK